ncbi:phosphate signaling complex protein PhoU [Fusibacter sp. JL298sf-3]
MRIGLDQELKNVHVEIIKMGTLLERTIEETVSALVKQDLESAQKVVEGDDKFDQMELDIESSCITLIATQQPVASDLREIFSIVKIITDLERIADHCQDISRITLELAGQSYVKPLIDIPKMAQEVKQMVKMTVDCFIDRDTQKAREICVHDDVVDAYFDTIRVDLEALMKTRQDNIKQCMDFLMIAKYFERMADHATNIAEWVIYSVEGKHLNESTLPQ